MKRIIPALLLAASVPAFAADNAASTADAAPVATYAVPTPAGFSFAVETQVLADDSYQVKITDQKTGKVQIIDDIIDFGPLKEKISDLVNIQDYNGDGHPDIAVRIVGAYTQSADELYLFNPATRQFKTPPDGQNIAIVGNVEVIRKGCIRVEYKSSIMDYDEEDYCWKNGGWEMLRLKNTNAHKKPKGK